jgi:hypothetical protein
MEIWKSVVGYEGRYEVSNKGRVKSLKRTEFMPWMNKNRVYNEKLLRHQKKDNHYLFVVLSDGGGHSTQKSKYIHRLVAEAFKGPIKKGQIVNHLDSDVSNNHDDNLEIISQRDNCLHGLKRRVKSSKYPGVHLEAKTQYWKSMARKDGKKVYLGKFNTEDEAFLAYKQFISSIEKLTHI